MTEPKSSKSSCATTEPAGIFSPLVLAMLGEPLPDAQFIGTAFHGNLQQYLSTPSVRKYTDYLLAFMESKKSGCHTKRDWQSELERFDGHTARQGLSEFSAFTPKLRILPRVNESLSQDDYKFCLQYQYPDYMPTEFINRMLSKEFREFIAYINSFPL